MSAKTVRKVIFEKNLPLVSFVDTVANSPTTSTPKCYVLFEWPLYLFGLK
jgi:hypothetical protein